MRTQVAILGAGIAGLASAWRLQKLGIESLVLEKQNYIGGLARSFTWNGFPCDFAAHRLFTRDEVILQQLLNLVPMGRHVRRSRIFLGGKWLSDPLDVVELAGARPAPQRLSMLWTYLARPRRLADDNFENFVLRRYGRSLYHLFFKPYTEKLFGIPGNQISAYWARQKVRLASPLDHYRENTKTKFAYFYYPVHGGYGAIVDKLYQEVKARVITQATVTRLHVENDKIASVHYTQNAREHVLESEHVISTLPLPLSARLLGHSLTMNYQKVDAVYLLLNRPQLSDLHWMYFVDEGICINRMVEFKNMSPVGLPSETTVICAEVTQMHADPVARVISDLERIGLITPDEVLDSYVLRENFAYPIYDQIFDQNIEVAQQTLSGYANLHLVGRAAEFRHREVDDNFEAAIETTRKIGHALLGDAAAAPLEEVMPVETDPKVIAVILTYNHYEDTQECLQSLAELDYPDLHVILVDNGSTDETPRKVRQEFPHVQVIENGQNLGVPAGYNVGFEAALHRGTDYVLMLNNDTVLPSDMLKELLEVAKNDAHTGIVMPKVLVHGSSDKIWSSGGRYRAFPPAILMTDNRPGMANSTRLIEYAPSCALLIHRQAFERAGLFDPGYFFLWDDWDFSERVRAHGLHIWYAPNAHMWHKVSVSTQGPRSPLYWRTFGASIARFFRRHGRPVWLSLPLHVGYVMAREFLFKRNWAYWGDFWQGVREGMQKPLGNLPRVEPTRQQS